MLTIGCYVHAKSILLVKKRGRFEFPSGCKLKVLPIAWAYIQNVRVYSALRVIVFPLKPSTNKNGCDGSQQMKSVTHLGRASETPNAFDCALNIVA